jgi:hypothetical protein
MTILLLSLKLFYRLNQLWQNFLGITYNSVLGYSKIGADLSLLMATIYFDR